MLEEEMKAHNRDLYEDSLKYFLSDYNTNDRHIVEVHRERECIFREEIPVFLKMTNYQVWGEYQIVIMWEDSSLYNNRRQYNRDGLHGLYSSNFVIFKLEEMTNALEFNDGENKIKIFL